VLSAECEVLGARAGCRVLGAWCRVLCLVRVPSAGGIRRCGSL